MSRKAPGKGALFFHFMGRELMPSKMLVYLTLWSDNFVTWGRMRSATEPYQPLVDDVFNIPFDTQQQAQQILRAFTAAPLQ